MHSTLSDNVTCMVVCTDGSCLGHFKENHIFLITSSVTTTAWVEESLRCIANVCGLDIDQSQLKPHRWFKIHLPNQSYVMSAVFRVTLTVEQKKMCKPSPVYSWLWPNELQEYHIDRKLTNPICLNFIANTPSINYDKYAPEIQTIGDIVEVSSCTLVLKSSIKLETPMEDWDLKGLQEGLFTDFHRICQPNVLMSQYHFVEIMHKFGLRGSWLADLFWAIDIQNMGFISYSEFACLVICVDPNIKQDAAIYDMRKLYLFRMFDRDRDSMLSKSELEDLFCYVRSDEDPQLEVCLEMMNVQIGKQISFSEFSENIDSVLSPETLATCLRIVINLDVIYSSSSESIASVDSDKVEFTDFTTRYHKTLQDRVSFEISAHIIHIDECETVLRTEDVWSLRDVCSMETLLHSGLTKHARPLSCELHSPKLIYNNLLRKLRVLASLNSLKSNDVDTYDWGSINRVNFVKMLLKVCNTTKKLVMQERRMLQIKSPAYILGAMNGSFNDLLLFERILWPRSFIYAMGSILFLGSYVDGASFGIEVITFLFCYKNLLPMKIFLLRGSHDNRWYQSNGSFQKECLVKFGGLGKQVWQAVNSVFDSLPAAATIDDHVLCVHSGIPQPSVCTLTNFIDKIPISIECPAKESHLLSELCTNEPRTNVNGSEVQVWGPDGFQMNNDRGTGFVFNQDALITFLDMNSYSHMIRTCIEPVSDGCTNSANGRLLTVCSTTNNNMSNNVACILMESGKIRVIRLEYYDMAGAGE